VETGTSFQLKSKTNSLLLVGFLVAIVCFAIGLFKAPERTWVNYLINNFYFVSMALSGGFILSIAYAANGNWSAPFKRILEAMTAYLPVGLVLTLGLYFGLHTLYEWTHHDVVMADPILSSKTYWLNIPGYMLRIVIFFVPWILFTKALRYFSRKQDQTGSLNETKSLIKTAVLFLIFFAFSFSLASFDWIMSLEPHWFSTIFGVYTFSGLFTAGLAFVILTTIFLESKGYLKGAITEDNYHDLGKLLFGFSTFWAYIWFSQYLLIWYSNIPEETIYYYIREKHTWDWLFYLNLAINWIVPFFALMTRDSKRSRFILGRVCIVVLIGHWLDLYLMVAPNVYKHAGITNPSIGVIEVLMALGVGCLFTWVVARALGKAPLLAKNDPYLEEAHNLHQ